MDIEEITAEIVNSEEYSEAACVIAIGEERVSVAIVVSPGNEGIEQLDSISEAFYNAMKKALHGLVS